MPADKKHDSYPVCIFKDGRTFERWLAKNHATAEGAWLKIAKAGSGLKSVTYKEAIDTALCYGWIDGQRQRLDDVYFVQKFTPRRANSIWSVINKQKAARLMKEGKMTDAGLAAVEAAKRNGRWESAYDSQKNIAIPDDLQKALDNNSKAKSFFARLSSQNRYAILFRIGNVKKPETRARKIEEYVSMLQRHETIHPQ